MLKYQLNMYYQSKVDAGKSKDFLQKVSHLAVTTYKLFFTKLDNFMLGGLTVIHCIINDKLNGFLKL